MMVTEKLPEIYGDLKIFSVDAVNLVQKAKEIKRNRNKNEGVSFSLSSLAKSGLFDRIWSKSCSETNMIITELGKEIISAVKNDLKIDLTSKAVVVGAGMGGGTALYAAWKIFADDTDDIYLIAMRSSARKEANLYLLEGSLNDFLDSIGAPPKKNSTGPTTISRDIFVEEFGDLFRELAISQIL